MNTGGYNGKRVRIKNYSNYPQYEGIVGVVEDPHSIIGDTAAIVRMPNGKTCVPFLPGSIMTAQCEWVDEEIVSKQLLQYIDNRIASLQDTYNRYKEAEEKAEKDSMEQLARSSQKSAILDTIKELEDVKKEYNKINGL